MTLDEARSRIGDGVLYRTAYDARNGYPPDQGKISSVGERMVFVHFMGDMAAKAVDPGALTFLAAKPAEATP